MVRAGSRAAGRRESERAAGSDILFRAEMESATPSNTLNTAFKRPKTRPCGFLLMACGNRTLLCVERKKSRFHNLKRLI